MKKTIAVIAIISIVFGALAGWVVPAHALSETVLSVTGQLLLDVPMLSTIFSIALNPMGLTPNLIAKAQSDGVNVVDVLETMIRGYAESHNLPISHLLNVTKNGLSYDSSGTLYWNDALSTLVTGFAEWAYDADGGNLIDYSSGTSDGFTASSELTTVLSQPISAANPVIGTFVISNGQTFECTFNKAGIVYDSGRNVLVCSTTPGQFIYTEKNLSTGSTTSYNYNLSNSYTYNNLTVYWGVRRINIGLLSSNSIMYSNVINNTNELNNIAWTVLYGDLTYGGNADTNIFDLPDDNSKDTNLVDPNEVVYVPDFGSAVGSVSTDIQSWIEATRDTILTGSSDLTITDTNGITSTVETDTTGTTTMQVIQTITTTLPPVTDVADETITGNIGQYSLDLRDYFPFCIPFDVFRILRLFNGSAQAPRVTWRFYVPNIVDYDIVIDLSPFDSVAVILRTMELISFCLGLAFVSKKLLFGS